MNFDKLEEFDYIEKRQMDEAKVKRREIINRRNKVQ